MLLRDRDGKERRRELRISALEGDADCILLVFDSPRDLEGTALLSVARADGDDDQWLYLPAFKRVKRVSSGVRSGSFMGSEFAYEDITSQEVDNFTYRYVGSEKLNGKEMVVVERYPRDAQSGYSRQVVWVDAAEYRTLRIDYYVREDTPLKTLRFRGYRRYAGRYWRPAEMEMVNHRSGASTKLIWRDYAFGTGLDKRDFDPSRLDRIR